MSSENLSPERQEELRAAKSAEELEQIAKKEGCELSVDMLDGAAGGSDTNCYQCKVLANCGGFFGTPKIMVRTRSKKAADVMKRGAHFATNMAHACRHLASDERVLPADAQWAGAHGQAGELPRAPQGALSVLA